MGKSYRNPGKLAGAWEVQVQRPLDDRHAVDTVDDLTNADTWKGSDGNYYHYNTMVVVVKSESRMYVYRGETGNVASVQDPDNWVAGAGVQVDDTLSVAGAAADAKSVGDRLKELELFKTPNVTIFGAPTIVNGQVSGFSAENYMQFPFIVDFRGLPFAIEFAVTLGLDIVNNQNVFDSRFGLAFAVRNSRFVWSVSSNGIEFNLGEHVGTTILVAQRTYYIRIAWDGNEYTVAIKDELAEDYQIEQSMCFAASVQPFPTQVYIGVGGFGTAVTNAFGGTINLNAARLIYNGTVVWTGMDDAGLSSRMAVDMSNIDEAGRGVVREIVSDEVVDSVDSDDAKKPLSARQGKVLNASVATASAEALAAKISADGKSAKRSTITPERDESGDFDFAFEITPETNAGVIDWRGNQSTLCIVANECPNEILVYFDGENPIADFAEYRIGEVPDFELGKMYVASYLDGIVAIAEVQPV